MFCLHSPRGVEGCYTKLPIADRQPLRKRPWCYEPELPDHHCTLSSGRTPASPVSWSAITTDAVFCLRQNTASVVTALMRLVMIQRKWSFVKIGHRRCSMVFRARVSDEGWNLSPKPLISNPIYIRHMKV